MKKYREKEGIKFQFTPLREGRPNMAVNGINSIIISIHAPPRGATQSEKSSSSRAAYFNSRPSARGDTKATTAAGVEFGISIHAPPRGATLTPPRTDGTAYIFQFTPLREGRH